MKVDIQNLQSIAKINKDKIMECADLVLKAMGESKAELSLVLVNDMYIRNLNWKYRRKDSATDVLAFPMRDSRRLSGVILGDVVISVETAAKEAKKRKKDLQGELDLYFVHGILHLLGYDDEKPRARKKMKDKEKELLQLVIARSEATKQSL
ncbi:MAG: rRNA maturation RNase YbeY [Candidatus Omnitrophica bacterium CG22_combo_CG10-13_8_21_14_all_43_16]|nr:MAG: rRNA maturation RNase YbeY [Candidatus Omnitrophica bacterium CG22_combo_CG10-13_8_21_14_all_43_16]